MTLNGEIVFYPVGDPDGCFYRATAVEQRYDLFNACSGERKHTQVLASLVELAISDWHVQLYYGEWIIWGYGPPDAHGGGEHIAPAQVSLGKRIKTVIEFKLPEAYDIARAPQEYKRKTCWGWTIRTNDLIHSCGKHLADSREAAIEAARAYAKDSDQSGWVTSGNQEPMVLALRDVREYQSVFD